MRNGGNLKHREVTVLGAGIGGLATALALARHGASVRIFEQSQEIGAFGAGLQISPNGMAVLRAVGVEREILERSGASGAVLLRSGASGRVALRMGLPEGFRLIHRGDLVSVLAAAAVAAGVEIVTGCRANGVTVGRDVANVSFDDGQDRSCELLIGADGVRSVLRAEIAPSQPFFTGQVAWRATVPDTSGLPCEADVFMGAGRHLVRYPLPARGLINLVGVEERTEWAEESWTASGAPADFQAAFSGFCPEVREVVERVDQVRLWGLFRHPVAPLWHRGVAALVGDAAHPTLPFLAQGANLALEDAFVLADCLSDRPPPAAFRLYQQRRRDRVVRAITAANGNARNYHLGGAQRLVAHAGLRAISAVAPALMLRRFDWLYGHDVTA